jgi:6-phosphogluconolactonase
MIDVKTFQTEQEWVNAIVAEVEAVCKTGSCYLGLAGGNTPIPVYEALGERTDLLPMIHAYEIDERYISAEDGTSNQHMIREAFGENINQLASVHFFDTEKEIEASIKEFAHEIKDVQLDVVLLGVGGDGHMASLFPGQIDPSTKFRTEHTTTETLAVYDRLTMTLPYLQAAKRTILMTAGASKKEVVNNLIDDNIELSIQDFPVVYLRKQPESIIYHLG